MCVLGSSINHHSLSYHKPTVMAIFNPAKRRKIYKEDSHCLQQSNSSRTSSSTPLLLVPNDDDSRYFSFYDAEKDYTISMKKLESISDNDYCIGSSSGWLMFVDEELLFYMFNPFTNVRMDLPLVSPLYKKYLRVSKSYFVEVLRRGFFKKSIVLLGSSKKVGMDFIVVVICECYCVGKLWLCKRKDKTWRILNHESKKNYVDVTSYDDLLYAMTDDKLIEIWDLNDETPIQRMSINPLPHPKMIEARSYFPGDLFGWSYYLVKSLEKVLLVVRYTGFYVNSNNKAIYESDLLTKEDTHPLICPYKTLSFDVFELDFHKAKWMATNSLGDRVLFLGGNQGVSMCASEISGFKEDSIYFTDDNWDQVDEDDLYGGHDVGVFNLKNKSVKPLHDKYNLARISPPPFWIIPHY